MDIWALKGYSGLVGAVLGNTPDNSNLWQAFSSWWEILFPAIAYGKIGQGATLATELDIFVLLLYMIKKKRGYLISWSQEDLQIIVNRYVNALYLMD